MDKRRNTPFSILAPPPENLRYKGIVDALAPNLIIAISGLSSLLFFSFAFLIPKIATSLCLVGIVSSLLIFLILNLVRQSSLKKLMESELRQSEEIKICDGKLHIPNYLKLPISNQNWLPQFSVFEISQILDFESQTSTKSQPGTLRITTKVKGKKTEFTFINSLVKFQEDRLFKAFKNSLPPSHHLGL